MIFSRVRKRKGNPSLPLQFFFFLRDVEQSDGQPCVFFSLLGKAPLPLPLAFSLSLVRPGAS